MLLRPCASNFCSVYVIPVDDVAHQKLKPYSMTRHPLQGSCTAIHGFHIATTKFERRYQCQAAPIYAHN